MAPASPLPTISRCSVRPGRSSSGLTALRGLHLDTTCAPALTWQLSEAGPKQDQPNRCVHAFRGTPLTSYQAATRIRYLAPQLQLRHGGLPATTDELAVRPSASHLNGPPGPPGRS